MNFTTAKKIFLTSTLPYINGSSHVGHLLELVQADCISRWFKSQGHDVFFNTGLDEHGQKIQEAAVKKFPDLSIQGAINNYISEMRVIWKDFYKLIDVQYDNFYLTATEEHSKSVLKYWDKLKSQGDLYKKSYTGLYCVGCEFYKTSSDIINGECKDHPGIKLKEVTEENYFFRLEKYKGQIRNCGSKLIPDTKKIELENIINDISDFSASRINTWGIPIPGEKNQFIYCWLSALANYSISRGKNFGWDDADIRIQTFGPDNIKFQACIWQGLLSALGLKHTDYLLVHGTVLDKLGNKMSKTVGNVIDPIEQIKKYSLASLRYYILCGLNNYSDSSYSEEELVLLYNNDLANIYGNLLSRTIHLINIYGLHDSPLDPIVKIDSDKISNELNNFQFKRAAETIKFYLTESNIAINNVKPWDKTVPDDLRNRVLKDVFDVLTEATKFYSCYFPKEAEIARLALLNKEKVILFPRIKIS